MGDIRIYELPATRAWDGVFAQDKVGGQTEKVTVAQVEARLIDDGFAKGSFVTGDQIGVANGLASLGADGKVPASQVNLLVGIGGDGFGRVLTARDYSDTAPRFVVYKNGTLDWGDGAEMSLASLWPTGPNELWLQANLTAYGFKRQGGLPSQVLLANGDSVELPYVSAYFDGEDGGGGGGYRIIGFLGTTTNDSAPAGCVGELFSSIVPIDSHVSLTSGTDNDVTSLTLGPGDWDVWGVLVHDPASTAVYSGPGISGSLSLVANTRDLVFLDGTRYSAELLPKPNFVPPHRPVAVASGSTTTVSLVAAASFASGTSYVYGNLYARRMR